MIQSIIIEMWIYSKLTYIWQGTLLGIILADQQSGVSPFHVEISVKCDTEVLVRHLGDVFDVNSNGDKGGFSLQGQVILLIVGWDTDPLSAPHCTDQAPS